MHKLEIPGMYMVRTSLRKVSCPRQLDPCLESQGLIHDELSQRSSVNTRGRSFLFAFKKYMHPSMQPLLLGTSSIPVLRDASWSMSAEIHSVSP